MCRAINERRALIPVVQFTTYGSRPTYTSSGSLSLIDWPVTDDLVTTMHYPEPEDFQCTIHGPCVKSLISNIKAETLALANYFYQDKGSTPTAGVRWNSTTLWSAAGTGDASATYNPDYILFAPNWLRLKNALDLMTLMSAVLIADDVVTTQTVGTESIYGIGVTDTYSDVESTITYGAGSSLFVGASSSPAPLSQILVTFSIEAAQEFNFYLNLIPSGVDIFSGDDIDDVWETGIVVSTSRDLTEIGSVVPCSGHRGTWALQIGPSSSTVTINADGRDQHDITSAIETTASCSIEFTGTVVPSTNVVDAFGSVSYRSGFGAQYPVLLAVDLSSVLTDQQ